MNLKILFNNKIKKYKILKIILKKKNILIKKIKNQIIEKLKTL